jgi:hypothetical protein
MSETHSGLRTRARAAAYETDEVKGIGRAHETHAAARRTGTGNAAPEGTRKHALLFARRFFVLAPAQDLLKNTSGMAANAQTAWSAGGSSTLAPLTVTKARKPSRVAQGARP